MRKKVQPQVAKKKRLNIILIIALIATLGFMTVGFAAYGQILDFSGTVIVQPQGKIRITNVEYLGGEHSTSVPTFTDTTIDLGLSFMHGNPQNGDEFTATYRVTIENKTFYNQIFAIPDYEPTILDHNGNPIDMADLTYHLDGITNGDSVPVDATISFTIEFIFNPPGNDDYTVEDDVVIEFTDEQTGQLFASITSSTTGDLRGSTTCTNFTVSVINTFDYARNFTFSIINNANFYVQNGSHNIPAKSTQSYTVTVCENDPYAQYSNSYERANIHLNSEGYQAVNAGRITLLVDQIVVIPDEDAPVISNLVATQQTDEGHVLLTWNATDESTIDYFTILVYSGNSNRPRATINTADDETEYVVTGLSDGTYYFKVYGTDARGNTAKNNEINNATTSSGHVVRTNSATYDWNFSITYSLSNTTSTNTASTIKLGQTYTTTLRGRNNNNTPLIATAPVPACSRFRTSQAI